LLPRRRPLRPSRGHFPRRHHGRIRAADPSGRFPFPLLARPRGDCRSRPRPIPRARRLRHRLRRPRLRNAQSRGRRHGARGGGARRPPRRSLHRQLGRRSGAAHADPPAAVLPGCLPPGPPPPAWPAVRRGRLLSPHRRRRTRPGRRDRRARLRRRRHPVPRLARRPGQPGGSRPHRPGVVSGDPASIRRHAGGCGGRRELGARALPRAAGDGVPRRRGGARGLLRLLAVLSHHRLQGPAGRYPATGVLHRLPVPGVRDGDRRVPSTVLHQHPAQLAAGAALPAAGPQR
jgi:hypothetical protein